MARKQFGTRGLSSADAARVNPYSGAATPLGGYGATGEASGIDQGLRTFMLSVYNYMFMGLMLTGVVAVATYMLTVTTDVSAAARLTDGLPFQVTETEYLTELGIWLWATPVSYLICFGPLLLLIAFGSIWRDLSAAGALAAFIVVSILVGISFSGIAIVYTDASIAKVFFATAAAFGGLSLFGYTTKRDLSGWASFLWMGLFGLLAAILINWILRSDALEFAFSVIGVLVFSGFTAYDTQMIKEAYSDRLNPAVAKKIAITGALDLYLDFVNLFRFLLAIFGTEE